MFELLNKIIYFAAFEQYINQMRVLMCLPFFSYQGNTQMTVNNQIVVGTLMNISDNPTRVSIGQVWRESDITHRIPIIFTGNDFSTLYAPLIRDGRMEKFYWYTSKFKVSILSSSVNYHAILVF